MRRDRCATQLIASTINLDVALFAQVDVEKLCLGIKPIQGNVQHCLRQKRFRLSGECQEQLFRTDVDDAGGLHLQPFYSTICFHDKLKVSTGAEGITGGRFETLFALLSTAETP